MEDIGSRNPFSYANAQVSIHLQMDTFVTVIPAIIGFVGLISFSCIDLMCEVRSEKKDKFSSRASCAAL